MKLRARLLALALAITSAVIVPASVNTQGDPIDWKIGDVFLGIGSPTSDVGKYLVFNPDGTQKEELIDSKANLRRGGNLLVETYTTGCAVGPAQVGEAFFSTNFYGLSVRKFEAAHPHAQSDAAQLDPNDADAVESLVFDNLGNYYVASHPSSTRNGPAGDLEPWAFIIKYSPQGAELARYEVPYGNVGVDWIDIGADNRTFYYTSESAQIFVYRAATETEAEFFDVIDVHERGGPAMGGTMYAIRSLPPLPGDATLKPSGFIIATSGGPIRTDADGTIILRYSTTGSRGFFFALNVTPDGQSFWSATTTNDGPPTAQLFRYRISQPDVEIGPIETSGANSWGLCVKREWTAATNVCVKTDRHGNAVLNAQGQPETETCRVPEICGNGVDEDGDGLDVTDSDCKPAGAPIFIAPPDQTNYSGDTNISLQLQAEDSDGDTLTFTVTGLPAGLSSNSQGLITGNIGWGTSGPPITVFVVVTDPSGNIARGRFMWTILNRNGPPTISTPGTLTCSIGNVCPALFNVWDPDLDSVSVTWSGAPAWWTTQVNLAQSHSTFSMSGIPLVEGQSDVTVCVKDLTHVANHAPVCERFILNVVNNPPLFTVLPMATLINTSVTLSIGATDPDNHAISYLITGLPAGLNYDAATGVITGTPNAEGVSTVKVTVTDRYGAQTTKSFVWTVFSNRPPVCSGASPTQSLWPPNHKMVNVGILGLTDPDGDAVTVTVTGIQQDEPPNGLGDGSTPKKGENYHDGYVDPSTRSAWVRAERTGNKLVPGDGRIYEIFFTASDGRATCSGSVFTGVPHDQGGRSIALDSWFRWNSITGTRIR